MCVGHSRWCATHAITAWGAVLFQDGKVCAYFSKKLGASERNYSATERELLAVVYALTEWRCYLLGKPVTVVTDHKCNTFLGQQVGLSPRRARWAERLQEFEIEWVWEPGKTNIADPLSRCFTQHGHAGSEGRDNGVALVAGAALRRKRPSPDSLTPSSWDVAPQCSKSHGARPGGPRPPRHDGAN
jgi:hypothetical protein